VLMTCSALALVVWVGVRWPSLAVAAIIAVAVVLLVQTVASRVNASLGVAARPIRMMKIAVTMHAAALQGWWHFLCGRRDVMWQHERSTTVTVPVDTVN